MVRGLLAGLIVATVLAIVACGGSSSSSATPTTTAKATASSSLSPSPTPSPTPPVAGSICNSDNLVGALVLTQGVAGTVFYQLGVTNVGAVDCILVNPPVVHFRNVDGSDLGIAVAAGTDCPAGGPYDPTTCLDEDAVDLPPGAATPGVVSGQLIVNVAVAQAGNFQPCGSPEAQPHIIGLRFTGTTSDVMVELPNDITVLPCPGVSQVRLHGYGPSKP
jgi:hypothetical protein